MESIVEKVEELFNKFTSLAWTFFWTPLVSLVSYLLKNIQIYETWTEKCLKQKLDNQNLLQKTFTEFQHYDKTALGTSISSEDILNAGDRYYRDYLYTRFNYIVVC